MQFKIITSVLLFFVAQTMATPNPQSGGNSCTLPSTVGFALKVETNHFFLPRILQALMLELREDLL